MDEIHKGGNGRHLTLMCTRCGWTVELPITPIGVDITPSTGWDVDQDRVLCERCAAGWQPAHLGRDPRGITVVGSVKDDPTANKFRAKADWVPDPGRTTP